jgi:four helix bundle protein
MPLQLPHKELDLFTLSKKLLHACYELTHDLPVDVRKTLFHEIRRAALFVYLDTCKGLSKSGKKKKKWYGFAKDQLLIIDAAIEVLIELNYVNEKESENVNQLMSSCFQLLTDLLRKKNDKS